MPISFDDLGFAVAYAVEVDPEFPPSGEWGVQEFNFGSPSHKDLVLRISPATGRPWVGSFTTDSRGLLAGVYAGPGANQLLVVTGLDAFLIPVDDPSAARELDLHPITAVAHPAGTNIVVLGSWTNLLGLDAAGVMWVTERLFLDDLEIVPGPSGKVSVRGSVRYPRDEQTLTIDPSSGAVVAGDWAPQFVPGQDQIRWRRPEAQ